MKRIIGLCLAFCLCSTSVFCYANPVEDPHKEQTVQKNDSTDQEIVEVVQKKTNNTEQKNEDPSEDEAQSFTMMSLNIVYYIVQKYLRNSDFDQKH